MTEAEAKTKWCPFAGAPALSSGGITATSRTFDGAARPDCHCIGLACMAWIGDANAGDCGLKLRSVPDAPP